jgi:hypothetical protein
MRQFFIVPLEDYNRLMGADEKLTDGEVMFYCTKSDYYGIASSREED